MLRLWKELVPVPPKVEVPSKVTVPLFGSKEAPVFRLQSPVTVNDPGAAGAVSVPLLIVTAVAFTAPVEPVNVQPLIVRPPLKA